MAYYAEEEEVWKCQKHPPSRRRRSCSGVCPICLKDRLSALCPDCAHLRPCSCPSSSTSSSSSASFSSSSSSSAAKISSLIADEPPFRRSTSSASTNFPFFRSARFTAPNETKTASFWRRLWRRREKVDIEEMKIKRSKSVAASITAAYDYHSSSSPAPVKGKGWYYLPSPMKVFRSHSSSKGVVNHRSPLHRG